MGFNDDAGTSVSCSYRSDTHSYERSDRKPVTHCQTVLETVGSDGSCVHPDSCWPAVHETPAVVTQDQGVFPKGKFALLDQGHVVILMCLRHVDETLVLVTRAEIGGFLSWHNANNGRFPNGLGSSHE